MTIQEFRTAVRKMPKPNYQFYITPSTIRINRFQIVQIIIIHWILNENFFGTKHHQIHLVGEPCEGNLEMIRHIFDGMIKTQKEAEKVWR